MSELKTGVFQMITFNELINKDEKVSVVGLGYVGFPLLIELAKTYDVIGFDVNEAKVNNYIKGIDETNEVGDELTKQTTAFMTSDETNLQDAKFHIVAVPTPINQDKTPNLTPIIEASKTVARNLTKGSIVVFESTVYPGTTEEICVPILEEYSNLEFERDFKVGYSPERINPGDKVNTLTNITKVVSGSDKEASEVIYNVYDAIIEAGIHQAPTIKVAEAAKVIENAQRDINIAFMNELSVVFNKMDINTNDVLKAAGTKWNFLKFEPGLVGGHCIGVDPYYFMYKAEELGYHSQIISAGRKINDEMGKHVASNVIKQLIHSGQQVKGADVAIFGITFKENVPDVRNTKIVDIINELKEYGVNTIIYDPVADKKDVKSTYNLDLATKEEMQNLNAIILAVPHEEFKELSLNNFNSLYEGQKVFVDIKEVFDRKVFESDGYYYWSL